MSFARLKYYYLSLEGKVKMIQDPFPPCRRFGTVDG
jgi:hypothetical protein